MSKLLSEEVDGFPLPPRSEATGNCLPKLLIQFFIKKEFNGSMVGLVLTAGGARGAYQAGVLKRIGEIPRLKDRPTPYSIITGASAGAINAAYLAAGSDNFSQATQKLSQLWGELQVHHVFRTDFFSLALRSARWAQDLSLGGMIGGGRAQSLLDFSPLRAFLQGHLDFSKIGTAIDQKHLYAVAISATSYYSGKSYAFIQGQPGHPLWQKARRASVSVPITADHIWASCAIPIVFQPVLISLKTGSYYFGDGGLRLTTPCSPAIRLGANRVFAIGIRSQKSAELRTESELFEKSDGSPPKMKTPPLAQIFGVALNSIFLDHLDADLDHLKRMNEILMQNPSDHRKLRDPMKVVHPFVCNPSVDLAAVAETHDRNMPRMVSYFMEGLGASKAQSADLLSYLLFHSSYTRALIDIGYKDAHERIAEIEEFLCGECPS